MKSECASNRKVRPGDYTTAANRYRVLLVEDEEAMAKLATFHLTQLNADVDRAKNGEEAIEMCPKKCIRHYPNGHSDASDGWLRGGCGTHGARVIRVS